VHLPFDFLFFTDSLSDLGITRSAALICANSAKQNAIAVSPWISTQIAYVERRLAG
jgi:hypothetical protein